MKNGIFLILILMNFIACALFQQNEERDIVPPPYRTAPGSILNYDDTARSYSVEIQKSHFYLHIIIDEPRIITAPRIEVPAIYLEGDLNGTAVYEVTLSRRGKIKRINCKKRAGLYMDEAALLILNGMKISPPFKTGKTGTVQAIITIRFKGSESP